MTQFTQFFTQTAFLNYLIILFGFILGACLGSFAKALADRSLSNRSFKGRSECEYCHHKLAFFDLLPIFSYLFLQGKCRYCHKALSKEYVGVEVVSGLLVALAFFTANIPGFDYSDSWMLISQIYDLVFQVFVIVVLVIVFITDLKKTIIPDRITYPAIIISLIALISITVYKIYWLYTSMDGSVLGRYLIEKTNYFQRHALYTAEPMIGSLVMGLGIGLFFLALILVTKGRGMGGGDLKLGIFLGLAFGFPRSVLVLMLAFLLGSIVGIFLMLVKKKHFGQTIPFGPFLALGGLITLYWGQRIIDWYLKLKVY
jgi:leader peptidase (prepilin peptidase) / N-methyltransferase